MERIRWIEAFSAGTGRDHAPKSKIGTGGCKNFQFGVAGGDGDGFPNPESTPAVFSDFCAVEGAGLVVNVSLICAA
jgi:hypothetical protein